MVRIRSMQTITIIALCALTGGLTAAAGSRAAAAARAARLAQYTRGLDVPAVPRLSDAALRESARAFEARQPRSLMVMPQPRTWYGNTENIGYGVAGALGAGALGTAAYSRYLEEERAEAARQRANASWREYFREKFWGKK